MNLDLTVNPDYSQVEEDRQQTNLHRFKLFFPERQQFFLENSDFFANLGNSTARPFFSRRKGLNIPVNFGRRLTGRIAFAFFNAVGSYFFYPERSFFSFIGKIK